MIMEIQKILNLIFFMIIVNYLKLINLKKLNLKNIISIYSKSDKKIKYSYIYNNLYSIIKDPYNPI